MNRKVCGVAVALSLACGGAASADVIFDWNNVLLDTIRATFQEPTRISRVAAMMNVAMYDAVNSVDRVEIFSQSYQPYMFTGTAVAGTSREVAAAKAAHDVLVALYPERTAIFNAQLNAQLAMIPDGFAKTQGMALGTAVCMQMLSHRATDGHDDPFVYVPGGNPGDWRPTPNGPNVPGYTPRWGDVTPWALTSGDQFRPSSVLGYTDMASLLASPEYAAQVAEVQSLGAVNSATRTADQTEAAWFWANDRTGTYKPPGQLLDLTRRVSEQEGLSLRENARLFAMVSASMADAAIAAWDAKYNTDIDLWRPIDAIRGTQDDGNPLTTPDPTWESLLEFSPPFPAWVSGHSAFGASHAAAMAAFFGTDEFTFTAGTDEPGFESVERTFHRFSDAAIENAFSRLWLGVHYRIDAEDGLDIGFAAGNWVVSHLFLPVPAPGAAVLGVIGLMVVGRRRR